MTCIRRRFYRAAERALAGGHDNGSAGVEGLDRAKVELRCIGWHDTLQPAGAAVGGAQNGAVGACRPCNSVAGGVDGMKVGGGGRGLNLPLSVGRDCREEEAEKEMGAHIKSVIRRMQQSLLGEDLRHHLVVEFVELLEGLLDAGLVVAIEQMRNLTEAVGGVL